jgi:hypothetical protein
MTTTKSLWRVLGAEWDDSRDDVDVIAVSIEGPGGNAYAVSCAGFKGMGSNDFITAIRAVAAALLLHVGGDMSVVGGEPANDPTFDTGDQRPN